MSLLTVQVGGLTSVLRKIAKHLEEKPLDKIDAVRKFEFAALELAGELEIPVDETENKQTLLDARVARLEHDLEMKIDHSDMEERIEELDILSERDVEHMIEDALRESNDDHEREIEDLKETVAELVELKKRLEAWAHSIIGGEK